MKYFCFELVIISWCWIAGGIIGFLPLAGWHARDVNNQPCRFYKMMDYNWQMFYNFVVIVTPAILLVGLYAHIYFVIINLVSYSLPLLLTIDL